MDTRTDLPQLSPAELDSAWLPQQAKLDAINDRLAGYRQGIRKAEAGDSRYFGWQRYCDSYLAETAEARARLEAAIEPFRAEWDRRDGWVRYHLCKTDGGHVHRLPCHTLRPQSLLVVMPEFSGLDVPELIAAAGYAACTHCFPEAPVHPAWISGQAANAASRQATKDQRAAERQARQAAADAKAITAADGTLLRDSTSYPIRTERAARIELVNDLEWSGLSQAHDNKARLLGHARYLAEAISAKTGENVEELLATAAAKAAKRK